MTHTRLDLTRTQLLEHAFSFVPMPPIDPQPLQAIYKNQLPAYQEVKDFDTQFTQLTNNLKQQCLQLQISTELSDHLITYHNHMLSRNYYPSQSHETFVSVKQAFESMTINLNRNTTLENDAKKRIMTWFLTEIIKCYSGVFNHVFLAKEQLENLENIEIWLANFRTLLIKRLAQLHAQKKNIPTGNWSHVENVFLLHAIKQGWNPYGQEALSKLNENHAKLADMTAADYQRFEIDFLREYNPESIMVEIASKFQLCLFERKKQWCKDKKTNHVDISDQVEWNNFFAGLPIVVNEAGGMDLLFDRCDDDAEEKGSKKAASPDVTYCGAALKLKSQRDLMISLTHYFIKINKPHFQYFDSDDYVLIKSAPNLCYIYTKPSDPNQPLYSGTLIPYNKNSVIACDFDIFTLDFALPLYNEQYKYYSKQGRQNFSKCTVVFDHLDLSDVTPDEKYLNYTSEQLGHLILENYHNNPFLIRQLMLAGADATIVNENNRTPIQVIARAAENNLTSFECLNAFACVVDHYDNRHFGDAILIAAVKNQTDVVKNLGPYVINFNWSIFSTENNALHLAAENNNAAMVKDLLHFGTSRSKLNKKNHTPMQTAAYANHWECVKAFACIVDENDEGRFGCALVLAAHANQTEVVLALLPFTKNLNWTIDSSGATSLHRAIENTNVPMLKALLHAGANILVENKAHETPLDLLVNNNNIDPDLLQEFAAVPNASYSFGDELYKSARKYNKNFSTLLGCCPSQLKWMQNGKKIHALPWALEKGDALLVRELLQNNSAFVSFSHEERMNMTNTAIQNKQFLCVHELVKKDGDLLYAQSKLASQAKDFYLFSIITSATQSPELRKQIFEENKDLLETKMKLVKKIYISLRAGQSRFAYKTSYDKWEQYENDPLLFIEKVASYAHKWKGSRTEKAWELASSYENELSANALEEKENHDADISIQLFKNIYQWSFANSNRFFKVSKSFGETFYKSSTFDTALNKQIITPDLRHIEQSKGSHRSQRILTALRK